METSLESVAVARGCPRRIPRAFVIDLSAFIMAGRPVPKEILMAIINVNKCSSGVMDNSNGLLVF